MGIALAQVLGQPMGQRAGLDVGQLGPVHVHSLEQRCHREDHAVVHPGARLEAWPVRIEAAAGQERRVGVDLQCLGRLGDAKPADRLTAGDERGAGRDVATHGALAGAPLLPGVRGERHADLERAGGAGFGVGWPPGVVRAHPGPVQHGPCRETPPAGLARHHLVRISAWRTP